MRSDARKRLEAHPLSRYFVAEDGVGDLGIWLNHADRPDYPTCAVYRFQFGDDQTLWDTLVAAIEAAS